MLFGHQNNDTRKSASEPEVVPQPVTEIAPTLNPLAVDPTTGVSLPVIPDEPQVVDATALQPPTDLPQMPVPSPTSAPTLDAPDVPPPLPPVPTAPAEPVDLQPVAEPLPEPVYEQPALLTEPPAPEVEVEQEPEPVATMETEELPVEEPTMPFDEPVDNPPVDQSPSDTEPTMNVVNTDELLQMKQAALAQLTPLVDQLDQTPEEKFRTKMMMIQSSDDQTLLRDAYDVAQAIPDEKVRAQALLDVINEINYFTSSQSNQ